jgi:hypothetical protein
MRRLLLTLQVVALAVGLTACGGDAIALDPVASAATKTVESGSSRVEFTIAAKAAGQSVDLTGSGLFDYRHPRGAVTYRMQLPGLGNVSMEMRAVGKKLYLRLPQEVVGPALPNGKPWFGIDLDKSLQGAGLGSFDFTQQDPAQTLQYLRAASSGVKESGSATVRGVETTRYVGRLNFRKALDAGLERLQLPAAERQRARQGMQRLLGRLGAKGMPFEVFVYDDGLLRRLTLDMSMEAMGQPLSTKVSMDYFDFGVDVDVQAPPARDVTDASRLLHP